MTGMFGQARPHYAALDGFRGILALFVAVYHTIWFSYPNSSAFLSNGAVIIDLFFAFSGFLMFSLYAERLKGDGRIKDFMVRRLARLMPLHLFMLAAFAGFACLRLVAHDFGIAHSDPGEVLPFEAGAMESWRNLLAHLTLTHAMGGADQLAFNPPSWTVGAEFYTYAVFAGAVGALGAKVWGRAGVLVNIGAITAIYATLFTLKPDMNITYDLGFFRCLAGFFIGGLAWRASMAGLLRLRGRATFVEGIVLAASTLFVIYCGGKAQFLVGPVLFVFVLVFTQDAGRISRALSEPIFAWLAKLSYSVYLVHVLIAIGFDIAINQLIGGSDPAWRQNEGFGTLLLIPYLATVIGVSTMTYRFVEVPGGRWVRRVFAPRPQRAVDVPTPAE